MAMEYAGDNLASGGLEARRPQVTGRTGEGRATIDEKHELPRLVQPIPCRTGKQEAGGVVSSRSYNVTDPNVRIQGPEVGKRLIPLTKRVRGDGAGNRTKVMDAHGGSGALRRSSRPTGPDRDPMLLNKYSGE